MMEKIQQSMMKKYKMFAWMGWLIVVIAFLLSLKVAGANQTFFSVSKFTREHAGAGDPRVMANVIRHSLSWWVPAFKFVGLGIMLGAITMSLGVIATTLRELGSAIMAKWPLALNPGLPEKPQSAKVFPMLMMMGWMVLLAGLILALASQGMVSSYWNNSIANLLNPAQPGSVLLNTLGSIQAIGQWITSLRFAGMAFLFTGITVALTVIIRTLQHQEQSLKRFIKAQKG
jgi:hypothetical protein